ncbi:hypothetical protein L9F63_026868, partial [Diploptera punctata]
VITPRTSKDASPCTYSTRGKHCALFATTRVHVITIQKIMEVAAAVVLAAVLDSVASQYMVQEVNVGTTAILPCPSNDDNHLFQYWELEGNQVIGPENAINEAKYKYEVLSGKLFIKSVSTAESGFYKCVSKALTNRSLNIQSVELIVKKDWEEVWENDTETNVYRGVIAGTVLIVLVGLMFLAYRFIKRRRSARFRDMSDEESPDEGPVRGKYNASNIPPMTNANITPSEGVDNPALDTDFPKMFNTIQTQGATQM